MYNTYGVHYWICMEEKYGSFGAMLYRCWFLYRAWKMCSENCGTPALMSRGGRPLLGLANLGGKTPVIPMAMYKKEFITAKPMIKMIPKKMLSNRPGSTTPTKRVVCCWRLDHNDVLNWAGESLVTSGWPAIAFSINSRVANTTPLTVKSTRAKHSWLDTKWLEHILRRTDEILALSSVPLPDFIYRKRDLLTTRSTITKDYVE